MTPDEYIFRQGSKTYYNAALLFPRDARRDVIELYSFVRIADNYVDAKPQHTHEFRHLVATWQEYRAYDETRLKPEEDDALNLRITKNICRLVRKHQFDPGWVDSFLHSMELDLRQKTYYQRDDVLRYVYGSAEVVGLMVAKIIKLSDEAMEAAAAQGRAMQWINFLRDIAEDIELGRQYFPRTELKEYGLAGLDELTAKAHPDEFRRFVRFQLERYLEWQRVAEEGMHLIPKRYRLPIQAATDAYKWTARRIAKDPFVVYRYQVKPSRARILGSAAAHVFD